MNFQLKFMESESVFEYWLPRINQIKSDKEWTSEKTGTDFADLLIKEPPAPQIIVQKQDENDDYDYDDEYGDEDYGPEV